MVKKVRELNSKLGVGIKVATGNAKYTANMGERELATLTTTTDKTCKMLLASCSSDKKVSGGLGFYNPSDNAQIAFNNISSSKFGFLCIGPFTFSSSSITLKIMLGMSETTTIKGSIIYLY